MGTDLPKPETTLIGSHTFKMLEISTVNSSVVPVVVVTPEQFHFVGTAFCISSAGIWVTARHVLEGRGGAIAIRDEHPRSYIAILWIGSDPKTDGPGLVGGPIPIRAFTRHPASGTDLAVLRTDRPELNFPALQLSAQLPVAETPVIGLGYPQFEVTSDVWTGAKRNVSVNPNLHSSSGKVLELYKDGRDTYRDLDGNFTGKLPTVCFETSARFDGGMSGGPVMNPVSAVCGVISTGLEARESDEVQSTSFVSGTPYLFMMNIWWRDNHMVSLYELAKRGVVPTDESFDRLRMRESDGQIDLYYED